MTSFAFDRWDDGRVTINRAFAPLFAQHGLSTFGAIQSAADRATVAKQLRTDRVTLRFTLRDDTGRDQAFYIKRHTPCHWREYVKPLLQLSWPTVGARTEWRALLDFHRAGLPTMTPVAIGEAGQESWLITAALEPSVKLSEQRPNRQSEDRRHVLHEVASLARRMHDARLHHQDFYLGHLVRVEADEQRVHVIDLGRVQRHSPWTARRWIVKDLAQLNYSARDASTSERLRFVECYLGRPITRRDKPLLKSILRKTARIAAHTRKNGL